MRKKNKWHPSKTIAAKVGGLLYRRFEGAQWAAWEQRKSVKPPAHSILKQAAELEYIPNRLAVALKASRKGAVGVLLHHFGSAGSDVVDRFLRGISSRLEQNDLQMWLRFSIPDEEFLQGCDRS